jgi:hypothetical protein
MLKTDTSKSEVQGQKTEENVSASATTPPPGNIRSQALEEEKNKKLSIKPKESLTTQLGNFLKDVETYGQSDVSGTFNRDSYFHRERFNRLINDFTSNASSTILSDVLPKALSEYALTLGVVVRFGTNLETNRAGDSLAMLSTGFSFLSQGINDPKTKKIVSVLAEIASLCGKSQRNDFAISYGGVADFHIKETAYRGGAFRISPTLHDSTPGVSFSFSKKF